MTPDTTHAETDWEKEFDKELTQSYPGDSGLGGHYPQDPVYEMGCSPEDVKEFIRKHLALAHQAGKAEERERIKNDLEGLGSGYCQPPHGKDTYGDGWFNALDSVMVLALTDTQKEDK